LSILGISLMATTGNSKKMASNEQQNQAAYYIAEAGLNLKKAEIKKAADQFRKETAGWTGSKLEDALLQPPKISTSTTYNSKNSNGTNKVFDTANASAKVTVSITPEPITKTANNNQITNKQNYIYKIKSVGTIDNQKRTLTSTMSYDLTVNSEEQAKPDEEIEGYYPIEGIPEASIHSLNNLTFSGGKLSGKLALGLDSSKYQDNIPFSPGADWGEYYDVDSKTSYSPRTCSTDDLKCLNTKRYSKSILYNQPDKVKLYPFPTTDFNELKTVQSNFPSNNKKQLPSGEIINSGTYYINNISDLNGKNINKNDVTIIIDNVQIDNKLTISGEGNLKIITKKLTTNGGVEINFSNNNLNILSTESLIFSTSQQIKSTGKIKLISPNLQLIGNTSFLTDKKVYLFSNKSLIFSVNKPFPNAKVNIFYSGKDEVQLGWIDINADIDFLYGYINTFNVSSFSGNVIFRNPKPNVQKIYINNYEKSLTTNFIYMPGFNVVVDSGKILKGVLVAKNIDVINGFISYDKPNVPTTKPAIDNGSNNSGSIITNSTFSDAFDSGTLEIDNER